jgi:hypothetical protein
MESKQPAMMAKLLAQQAQFYLDQLKATYAGYDTDLVAYISSLRGREVLDYELDAAIAKAQAIVPVLDAYERRGKSDSENGHPALLQQVAAYRAQLKETVSTLESKRGVAPMPPPTDASSSSGGSVIPQAPTEREVGIAMAELKDMVSKGVPYPLAYATLLPKYPWLVRH